jgi:hypothetical protein
MQRWERRWWACEEKEKTQSGDGAMIAIRAENYRWCFVKKYPKHFLLALWAAISAPSFCRSDCGLPVAYAWNPKVRSAQLDGLTFVQYEGKKPTAIFALWADIYEDAEGGTYGNYEEVNYVRNKKGETVILDKPIELESCDEAKSVRDIQILENYFSFTVEFSPSKDTINQIKFTGQADKDGQWHIEGDGTIASDNSMLKGMGVEKLVFKTFKKTLFGGPTLNLKKQISINDGQHMTAFDNLFNDIPEAER